MDEMKEETSDQVDKICQETGKILEKSVRPSEKRKISPDKTADFGSEGKEEAT